ncbi:hypothetical protein GCM10011416_04620 [Polaribacter pacificus]|uniref:Uncharacterized protein n=1 Tax=Polaribacter pacificus TaxID=1775173 RepID=A0A917HUH8_9FLAO|nr:hypothetical protein [Polaribacter pacificus]GGG91136.1 hypothetical protein GCM10011416_04620 [Polaribacter pacificus]
MMAQLLDHSLLLYSIGTIIFMLVTYLFITFNQFKVTASQSISELKNELLKEKIVRYHYQKYTKELENLEESTQIKFQNIRLKIMNMDFTLSELFKNLS